MYWIWNIR